SPWSQRAKGAESKFGQEPEFSWPQSMPPDADHCPFILRFELSSRTDRTQRTVWTECVQSSKIECQVRNRCMPAFVICPASFALRSRMLTVCERPVIKERL